MAIQNISYDGFNAGIVNKYPYTDFHEMNLSWLLTNYQAIIDKTNQIIDWANNHQIEYEDAIRRLTIVENEIATFEAEVTAAFERLEAQIRADMEQALTQMRADVDAAIVQMQNEVAAKLAEFNVEFQRFKAELIAEINALMASVNRAINELTDVIEANNQFMFEYIDNRLDQFIHDLPIYEEIYVYNPYRGETTTLQVAIDDLYSIAAIWGLTAQQYDSLGLTADEYDNLNLSAIEYDTLGYKILFKDPNYYMINPFTGDYDTVQTVIGYLVSLHRDDALTATEYDALDLDATDYDAYQVDAYDYDFSGKTILV